MQLGIAGKALRLTGLGSQLHSKRGQQLVPGGHIDPAHAYLRQFLCWAHDIGSVDQHGWRGVLTHSDEHLGGDAEGDQALLHQQVGRLREAAAVVME